MAVVYFSSKSREAQKQDNERTVPVHPVLLYSLPSSQKFAQAVTPLPSRSSRLLPNMLSLISFSRSSAPHSLSLVRLLSASAPTSLPHPPPDSNPKLSHPEPKPKLPLPRSEKDRLLDALLPHVPLHGFTTTAISRAVGDLGWSPAAAGLLPPPDAVARLITRFNTALPSALAALEVPETSQARAAVAIQTRIALATPYRVAWRGALTLQASQPQAAALSSALLADEIAHYAGYRTPDFSWYTDRAVLAAAFHAAEVAWVADVSVGQAETWRTLERGLERAQGLRGGVEGAAGKAAGMADAGLATLGTIIRAAKKSY